MIVSKTIYQTPQPFVTIHDVDTDETKYTFFVSTEKVLQSYQFSLSNGDVNGSFTLTFFPEFYNIKGKKKNIFDDINIKDVVNIFEGSAETGGLGKAKCVFTGIITRKRYVMTAGDGGATRKLSVSGTAITGLVSRFLLSTDASSCATLNEFTTAGVATKLTTDLAASQGNSVGYVIKTIWDAFKEVSGTFGTPKIAEYIDRFLDKDASFFETNEEDTFKFPLGNVFNGDAMKDFFSLIDGIIPSPIYEKTAYMRRDGEMRIRIRQVPFSKKEWQALEKQKHEIKAYQIKSVEVEASDKEVYTVFFSYLNGYPIDEDKALRLAALINKGGDIKSGEFANDKVEVDRDKFKIYGYRPLICHFIGYQRPDVGEGETGKDKGGDEAAEEEKKKKLEEAQKKSNEADGKVKDSIKSMSSQMKEWYGRLDEMLSGSVTLAMTYDGDLIMPGDIVSFMGGEFYVEGIAHSWNYGSSGEINISVSRGGSYDEGVFSKLEDFTSGLNAFLKDGKKS